MSAARICWDWRASVVTGRVEHSTEAAGYEAKVSYWPTDQGERRWSVKAELIDVADAGQCRNFFAAAFADADAAADAARYHKTRLAKIIRRRLAKVEQQLGQAE